MFRRQRLYGRILRAWVGSLRKSTPLWVIFYVTRRCNLQCDYCFFTDNKLADPPLDEMLRIVDKIAELGCGYVSITGGEPTLRSDLSEIIQRCSEKRIISQLNTNGIILDESYIRKLGEARIDIIQVSIDSFHRFDRSRKDLYRRRARLELLHRLRSKYNYELISNMVLTRDNLDELVLLSDYMHERDIPMSVSVKFPIEGEFDTDEEKRLLEQTVDEALNRIERGYDILSTPRYLNAVKRRLREPFNWKCSAGKRFFVLDTDSNFRVCDRLPMRGFGLDEINLATLYLLADEGERARAQFRCPETCLINCSYETSEFPANIFSAWMARYGKGALHQIRRGIRPSITEADKIVSGGETAN